MPFPCNDMLPRGASADLALHQPPFRPLAESPMRRGDSSAICRMARAAGAPYGERDLKGGHMKTTFALILIAATALSACSRTRPETSMQAAVVGRAPATE